MLYPINIELENINITVIGGGEVAYRKCKNFIEFGKKVKVVSKSYIKEFEEIKEHLDMIIDEYKEKYIKYSYIVVGATDNKEINKKIGIYCRENGKLVNIVDDKQISNYTVPSYIKRGDLLISVSTNGKSPSLSSKIKKEISKTYDDSYEDYIRLLGETRELVLSKIENKLEKRKVLNSLVNLTLEELKLEKEKYN